MTLYEKPKKIYFELNRIDFWDCLSIVKHVDVLKMQLVATEVCIFFQMTNQLSTL